MFFRKYSQQCRKVLSGFNKVLGLAPFGQWLRTITRNKIHDHFRKALLRVTTTSGSGPLDGCCIDGDDSEIDEELDDSSAAGEKAAIVQGAINMVRREFRDATWQSFWLTAMEEKPASEVALQLRLSAVAVRKNKSRVLNRIRTVLQSVL